MCVCESRAINYILGNNANNSIFSISVNLIFGSISTFSNKINTRKRLKIFRFPKWLFRRLYSVSFDLFIERRTIYQHSGIFESSQTSTLSHNKFIHMPSYNDENIIIYIYSYYVILSVFYSLASKHMFLRANDEKRSRIIWINENKNSTSGGYLQKSSMRFHDWKNSGDFMLPNVRLAPFTRCNRKHCAWVIFVWVCTLANAFNFFVTTYLGLKLDFYSHLFIWRRKKSIDKKLLR